MKVTILYDNESQSPNLQSDWGFSCLVSHGGVNLLFDTGADGALLLRNMRTLGVDPGSIQEVFVSHVHFDHSGGLSSFLGENQDVRVCAPDPLRGIRSAREVVYVDNKPAELRRDFFTTGLLEGLEQSLVVRTERGPVVVVGCAHPGVEAILEAARPLGEPYALIGGLHEFAALDALQSLSYICPTHCTQHIAEIRSRYPDRFIPGGVGAVFEV